MLKQKISKFRELRKKKQEQFRNLVVVKRSNKVGQALNLPKVLNLNPRSIYKKINEFVTFIDEEQVDLPVFLKAGRERISAWMK